MEINLLMTNYDDMRQGLLCIQIHKQKYEIRNKHHILEINRKNLTYIFLYISRIWCSFRIFGVFCIFHEYWRIKIKAPRICSLNDDERWLKFRHFKDEKFKCVYANLLVAPNWISKCYKCANKFGKFEICVTLYVSICQEYHPIFFHSLNENENCSHKKCIAKLTMNTTKCDLIEYMWAIQFFHSRWS